MVGKFAVNCVGKRSISMHLSTDVISVDNRIIEHARAVEFGYLNLLAML